MPVTLGSNAIVLGPGARFAWAIASRRLPTPLSLLLVTVNVTGGVAGLYSIRNAAGPRIRVPFGLVPGRVYSALLALSFHRPPE